MVVSLWSYTGNYPLKNRSFHEDTSEHLQPLDGLILENDFCITSFWYLQAWNNRLGLFASILFVHFSPKIQHPPDQQGTIQSPRRYSCDGKTGWSPCTGSTKQLLNAFFGVNGYQVIMGAVQPSIQWLLQPINDQLGRQRPALACWKPGLRRTGLKWTRPPVLQRCLLTTL